MHIQLPDYDDFGGLSIWRKMYLAEISKRIYEGFSKPRRLTLKHRLFAMHMQKKLFNPIREIPIKDKKCVF